jgi:hypothetical protein
VQKVASLLAQALRSVFALLSTDISLALDPFRSLGTKRYSCILRS